MQDCIGVTYTATQSRDYFRESIIHQIVSAKVQDCIGVTYTATQSTLELSAKVQDCIGVTYTATQSTLELFKLEVDYSSTSFWQK